MPKFLTAFIQLAFIYCMVVLSYIDTHIVYVGKRTLLSIFKNNSTTRLQGSKKHPVNSCNFVINLQVFICKSGYFYFGNILYVPETSNKGTRSCLYVPESAK